MPSGRQLGFPGWRHVCGTPSCKVDDEHNLGRSPGTVKRLRRRGVPEKGRRSAGCRKSRRGLCRRGPLPQTPNLKRRAAFAKRAFSRPVQYPSNQDYQQPGTVLACILLAIDWIAHMPIMSDLSQEKQRISDQLARLDAERSRLQQRFDELEVAERVLSRFGTQRVAGRRRGRPSTMTARPPSAGGLGTRARRGTRSQVERSIPLGEATLKAVQAHASGVSAEAIRSYLLREFGLQVRPNHLGMALQRHRQAGHIEMRNSSWFPLL